MTHSNWRNLKAWLPSAIWLAVIALESTNLGSSQNTSRFLYPAFHYFFGMDPVRFEVWHHALRKCGHFVGYFTLSVLLFRSFVGSFPGLRPLVYASLALASTSLVACLDEWHQSFFPSRTSLFSDVVLDSVAGFTAQIAILVFWRMQSGRRLDSQQGGRSRSEVSDWFEEVPALNRLPAANVGDVTEDRQ